MWFLKPLILFTLLAPSFVFAAGFAKESLFLSKSPATEGDTVFIHAIVANDLAVAFVGDVIFEDGDTKIGTVAVSIPAGGAETASLPWSPSAGTHPIVAELTAKDGTVVEKLSATFAIRAKPKTEDKTTSVSSTTVQSSENVKEAIAGISPGLAEASEPVLATIDSFRQKGADALDKALTWAKKPEGEIAGASTGMGGTVLGIVKTVLTYLMEVLRFVLSNAGVFYPAFAIGLLYFLWRMFKRYRRPSYE